MKASAARASPSTATSPWSAPKACSRRRPAAPRVFRATAGTWAPVQSLGAAPGGSTQFARALAVDDTAGVDRLVISPQPDLPAVPTVDVYADSGAGFALEQSIQRDTGDPDSFNGALFGNTVSLDGDLIAVSARGATVPSAEVGHDPTGVGYVQLFRRSATWTREAEVATFVNPGPVDVKSMYPIKLQVVGNHVAASVFVNPDPPVGCQFPCFVFGWEAWSIDRVS